MEKSLKAEEPAQEIPETSSSISPSNATGSGEIAHIDVLTRFFKTVATEVRREDACPVEKSLKQFATVGSIGGLITLLGTATAASPQTIAAVTLGAVVVIYIFIYRHRLNARVNVAMLLFALVTIIVFSVSFRTKLNNMWISYTISESTGIIAFSSKANDFMPRIGALINEAQEEIWFTGISFYISLPQYEEQLEKRARDGLSIRFLVYDPLAKNLEEVAAGFGQSSSELEPECRSTVSHLISMQERLPDGNIKGSFEVRLFSSVPKARVYIFDRSKEAGFTFFIPHMDNRNSPLLPGFLARNIKNGIAPAYHEGAVSLWKASLKLEEWRKVHPEFR